MTSLAILVLAVTFLLVFFASKLIIRSAKRHRSLKAALNAQIARESGELDLDTRLGPKLYVEIADSATLASPSKPSGAVGRTVDRPVSDKLKIAYRQTGHGPDILCVHGIGASMVIYRRLVPWLANDYRVTCVDLPGFGASSKPRTLSYGLDEQAQHLDVAIQELKLDSPLIVASSMGGAIALAAALRPDARFRGIVALAPAVDPRRVPLVLLPLAKYGDRLHRVNSVAAVRAVLSQVIGRRELITPSLVALYQEPFRDQGDSSSAFLKAFALLADIRMPKMFSKLETPLLIIRGLRDKLVKQAGCEDLHRIVKNSKIITHPTAGHHIMEDEPEFTARAIRQFDAEIPPRA